VVAEPMAGRTLYRCPVCQKGDDEETWDVG
jgi:hypothetical protein